MANLVDTIHGMGTFTAFTRALEMSQIALALREQGTYTVFAPTDAAFAQMHEDMREDLFEDLDDLSKVVKYHIVLGRYTAANLLDVAFLKTMEGQRLRIRSSLSSGPTSEKLEDNSDVQGFIIRDTFTQTLIESIRVNGATITRGDVSADNGVVHVIDKVLIPHYMLI
jgi:uncharacterized surface protein with fasciclin (FAS1) repeats